MRLIRGDSRQTSQLRRTVEAALDGQPIVSCARTLVSAFRVRSSCLKVSSMSLQRNRGGRSTIEHFADVGTDELKWIDAFALHLSGMSSTSTRGASAGGDLRTGLRRVRPSIMCCGSGRPRGTSPTRHQSSTSAQRSASEASFQVLGVRAAGGAASCTRCADSSFAVLCAVARACSPYGEAR